MRSQVSNLAAGVAALLAALSASGCGQDEIDVAKAAKLIQTSVETQVGADVRSVSCPTQVKAKANATFECVVTGSDGTKGTATITQKDGSGAIAAAAPFLHTREAEQSIQMQLRKSSPGATVTCPEIVIVAKGRMFRCKSTTGVETSIIRATQTSDTGNFSYRVLR